MAKALSPKVNRTKVMQRESSNLRLCRLIEDTFGKINELRSLLAEEDRLTGQKNGKETLEPILKRQEDLSHKMEAALQHKNRHLLREVHTAIGKGVGALVVTPGPSSAARMVAGPTHSPASSSGSGRSGGGARSQIPPPPDYFPRERDYKATGGREFRMNTRAHHELDPTPTRHGYHPELLQPDQKYRKYPGASSSFQYGLPVTPDVPTMSNLKPIQAHLMPTHSLRGRTSKSRSVMATPANRSRPGTAESNGSMNCSGDISHLSNESNWSYQTAPDNSSFFNSSQDGHFDELNTSANRSKRFGYGMEEAEALGAVGGNNNNSNMMEFLDAIGGAGDSISRPHDRELSVSIDNLRISNREQPWEGGDGNSNLQLETTKPFEMSDFYKYSQRWKKFIGDSSHPIVLSKQVSTGVLSRRDQIIAELSKGRGPSGSQPQPPQSLSTLFEQPTGNEPPLPPRNPRNHAHARIHPSAKPGAPTNEAWMDTPTIV